MLVDGQMWWQETVSFLPVVLRFLMKQEASFILILCICRHVPGVSHSPACVLIPAHTSLFTPGTPVSFFSTYPDSTWVSESNSACICSVGLSSSPLPKILLYSLCSNSSYRADALFSTCYLIPSWQSSFHVCISYLLLDWKHCVGWIDLRLPLQLHIIFNSVEPIIETQ